jgi:carnitine O-acetyltransferase
VRRVPANADWFDVLDDKNRLLLSEREILRNLQAIVADADKLPVN